MVILIIIFMGGRVLQLLSGAPVRGRTGRPPTRITCLPQLWPSEGSCSYGDADRYVRACPRICRSCWPEGKRCVTQAVLCVVVKKVDAVVGIPGRRDLGYSGWPSGVADDFCPNYFLKLQLHLVFVLHSQLLHLNLTKNIFILYEHHSFALPDANCPLPHTSPGLDRFLSPRTAPQAPSLPSISHPKKIKVEFETRQTCK